MRQPQIYNPSGKILLVCAEDNDIDDGHWAPASDNFCSVHDFTNHVLYS